jgi:hypothetical protein
MEELDMKLADITRMARSADPKYPAVRNALIGSVLAGFAALGFDVVNQNNLDFLRVGSVGVAAYLGWAIAREIDPDHQTTALIALAGSASLAIWLLPYLLLSAVTLAALRLLVGTVAGGGPTRLDLVVMVALAAYSGWWVDGWFIAVIIVVGILVSTGREGVAWALAATACAVGVSWWSDAVIHPGDESLRFAAYPVLLVLVVLLALPISPKSTTDIGKQPLDPARLRAGRVLAGMAVISALFASDVYGLTNLGPLTAAVVAAALAVPFTWHEKTVS